ncbi:MAG TPA: hypothetical protein VHE35_17805 [Kofleriaceae bacterium]|nr:hypothetical protein [Kofleriaceae bacterium]
MLRRRTALVLMVAAGCTAGDGGSANDARDGGPFDDSSVEPIDGGVGDGSAPGDPGPRLLGIGVPANPEGQVELSVRVRDDTSATVDLALELSCDGGASWRPATVVSSLTGLPAGPDGVTSLVEWSSVDDTPVHAAVTCALRATATDADGLASRPLVVPLPPIDNLRAAARRVDHYMSHYGSWSDALVATARRYQLVILDPLHADLTRERVAAIQQGADPADPSDDVIVLCYVSVGEDIRTATLSDDELRTDPHLAGDGTGPRVDPRGPFASGMSLAGIDPLGRPSPGGSGYASYYLDDNDILRTGHGDGRPDRNGNFGGAFVNAGDPAWYDTLRAMTLDGPDGVAGIDEILTDHVGRGLACDGLFLDTYDTAAPNSYTDLGSSNLSQFEWTAPGFRRFTERLRGDYPHKVLLQNRGLFFFDPRHPQFAFGTGDLIDLSLFESFRLDSSRGHDFYPTYYGDNRFNVAPKLMAEAGRDGFRVLSLGYAEGPPGVMSEQTLVGGSTVGLASLLEDIRVAQLTGFRHYLTSSSVTLLNTFVLDHGSLDDVDPPAWTSTYNDHDHHGGTPAGEPTPRIGVQEVVAGPGLLTVRWDVALDLHRVGYAAYVQDHPFDFAADPTLSTARRVVLRPRMGPGYVDGVGPDRYPNEDDLGGLTPGTTYYVVIRAFEERLPAERALALEDDNQQVLSGVPTAP